MPTNQAKKKPTTKRRARGNTNLEIHNRKKKPYTAKEKYKDNKRFLKRFK